MTDDQSGQGDSTPPVHEDQTSDAVLPFGIGERLDEIAQERFNRTDWIELAAALRLAQPRLGGDGVERSLCLASLRHNASVESRVGRLRHAPPEPHPTMPKMRDPVEEDQRDDRTSTRTLRH